jgi:hypothetical protein
MNSHASQVAQALVKRCHVLLLAAKCLALISVALAIVNSAPARSSPANTTVAQGPPVTAATRAEPCYQQRFDEGSDFLYIPDTFGPEARYRPAWFVKPQSSATMHCAR